MKKIQFLLFASILFITTNSYAQCDEIAANCSVHIGDGYISDGQAYRALLNGDEMAEFHTTFYGQTSYRIAACSGNSDGNLIIRIMDKDRNLIYSNAEYQNAPYWNFEVNSTVECIIEAQLDPTTAASGCAVLLIGFSQ